MPKSEKQGPEGLQQGKREAFFALVERYQDRLYSFASRICRNGEDAKDALQETFLAAFRAWDDYRGEGTPLAWLYKIATNACLKMRRKGKFEPDRELSLEEFMPSDDSPHPLEIPDWSGNPEAAFLRKELEQAIEEGIALLPKPYQVVLVLRDVEGFSTEEVGEILGLSVPAVKSRLHRARLFLRKHLSGYFPGR